MLKVMDFMMKQKMFLDFEGINEHKGECKKATKKQATVLQDPPCSDVGESEEKKGPLRARQNKDNRIIAFTTVTLRVTSATTIAFPEGKVSY